MNKINIFLTYDNIYEINKDNIILLYQENDYLYKIFYNRNTKKSKIYKINDRYLSIERIHRNNIIKLFKTPDLFNVIQSFTSENRIINFDNFPYCSPINLNFDNRLRIYFDADDILEIDDIKMIFKISFNMYGNIYLNVNYHNMSRQMYSEPINMEQEVKLHRNLRCYRAILCPKALVWIHYLNSLSKIMELNQNDFKKIIIQMLKSDSDFLTHDYIEEIEYESDEE